MVSTALAADRHIQPFGQSVDNRRTNTVETAACLIGRVVKLTSGVKGCEYKTFRGNAFLVHAHGDTSAIIRNSGGAVFVQCHMDLTAKTGQMLVHRVVNNLIDEVVQALAGDTADVHAGTLADGFETFQHGNAVGIIRIG